MATQNESRRGKPRRGAARIRHADEPTERRIQTFVSADAHDSITILRGIAGQSEAAFARMVLYEYLHARRIEIDEAKARRAVQEANQKRRLR